MKRLAAIAVLAVGAACGGGGTGAGQDAAIDAPPHDAAADAPPHDAATDAASDAAVDAAPAAVYLDPPAVDFGAVANSSAQSRDVLIVNHTTGSASVTSVTVTGTGFSIPAQPPCIGTLSPGDMCTVAITLATGGSGDRSGTLSVVEDGHTLTASLSALIEDQVTVVKTGAGTGRVTSSPAGIDCGSSCSALTLTDLTLSATADAGSTFLGFSGACAGTTCSVLSGTVQARFELTSSLVPVTIAFAGDAGGEVELLDASSRVALASCSAGCTAAVAPGEQVVVSAGTPSTPGGITGACNAQASDSQCTFTASAPTSITATFAKDSKEQWTLLGSAGETFVAAAYDPTNHLVVGSQDRLMKLDGSGNVVWSDAMPVTSLAVADANTIYALSNGHLVRLDGNGSAVWSVAAVDCATGVGDPARGQDGIDLAMAFPHCLAVAPNGDVIAGGAPVAYTGSGAVAWSQAAFSPGSGFEVGFNSVAVDTSGTVYAPQTSTDTAFDEMEAQRFTSTGSATGAPLDLGAREGMLIGDGSGDVVEAWLITSSGGAGIDRYTPAGANPLDFRLNPPSTPMGVGVSTVGTSGELVAVVDLAFPSGGFLVQRVSSAGASTFRLVRTGVSLTTTQDTSFGVAGSPDGHVAVVGNFAFDGHSAGWIQVFTP